MFKQIRWENINRALCVIAAGLFLIGIILKLLLNLLSDVKLEYLLIGFVIMVLLPYLTKFDAFGVKLEMQRRVDDLTDKIEALPDYVLGSEYESDGDLSMAENSYNASLDKCKDFWPSILGLASIYSELGQYEKAINGFNRVLKINPENAYALNNLADAYISAAFPIKNPQKALEFADKALEIVPSLGHALYYKGWALNLLGKYDLALEVLKGMIDSDIASDIECWIRFEMAISLSNLDKRITKEDLELILIVANKNNEGESLIDSLDYSEEQKRFNINDLPVINEFVIDYRSKYKVEK